MSSEIKVDTISENTSANGVVIDSVTLKDGAVTATAASTITTADTSTNLTLKSTDASASAAPRMIFERDSASPADSDQLGLTMYFADNDAGESTNFFEIKALAVDVSDGTEDGQLRFSGMNGGSSVEYMRFDPGSAGTIFNDGSADIEFRVESNGNTHALFVDAGNDRVGIGTSSPSTLLELAAGTLQIRGTAGAGVNGTTITCSDSTTQVDLSKGGSSSHSLMRFANSNGFIGSISTSSTSTAFNTSSDYRLKENVNYDWDGTTELKKLKPAKFNFKTDASKTLDGFLAHEVSSIVPIAVSGDKDGVDENGDPEYQGIDQSKLVPLLVKTVQELEARIKTLEDV